MAKNRLEYALILLCTALFYICFVGYLSFYVFMLTLILPLFSLLCSLPAMLGVHAELHAAVDSTHKGESLPLRLQIRTSFFLPGGRVKLQLQLRNTLTGEETGESFSLTAGHAPVRIEHRLASEHCGRLIFRISELRVYDYLGLFSFRKRQKRGDSFTALCYPKVHPIFPGLLPSTLPDLDGDRYSTVRSGDDPSEIFGLRDYREGDRLSRIHWKLSEKSGKTLVKELSLPISTRLLFLLDLNGDSGELDCLLDALASLSAFLAAQELPHRIQYRGSGGMGGADILREDDLPLLWKELLCAGRRKPSQPLLEPGQALPSGITHAVLLCSQLQPEALSVLRDAMPSARLTVLAPQGCLPIPELNVFGAELLRLDPEKLPESLSGFML